jgi:hypothetical protein
MGDGVTLKLHETFDKGISAPQKNWRCRDTRVTQPGTVPLIGFLGVPPPKDVRNRTVPPEIVGHQRHGNVGKSPAGH